MYLRMMGVTAILFAVSCRTVAAESTDKLHVDFGERGLASLSFNGELLSRPLNGVIRAFNYTPSLQHGGHTFQGASEPNRIVSDNKGGFTEYYDEWGSINAMYAVEKNKLSIQLEITNNSKDVIINRIQLNVIELTFLEIPQGHVLEAGMFGTGGGWYALHNFPFIAQPDQAPPVIEVRDAKRKIDFVSENVPNDGALKSINIPFTTNPANQSYPFCISLGDIPAGSSLKLSLSLRFGEPSDDLQNLSGDILRKFQDAYPFQLEWPSHAPIGALFLATSQKHPERNPRGWFLNAPDVDVTTESGLLAWRQRLLKFADDSVKVLKDIGAQGMITWDPEGEEYASSVYYGAPQLTATLAPETEFVSGGAQKAIDEYFAKFRDAGLRTGIAIRPQELIFLSAGPTQQFIDDPLNQLSMKVRYARRRWGCTLFYIDSTVDKDHKALSADIMRELHAENPGVLLIPENKNVRDYSYTAPLNAFVQFGITNTPETVTEVYKNAFSVLFVGSSDAKKRTERQALTDAVRRGDILLVSGWYRGAHTELVRDVYKQAGRWPPR